MYGGKRPELVGENEEKEGEAAVVASVFNLESVCVSSAGNLLLPGFMQQEEEQILQKKKKKERKLGR